MCDTNPNRKSAFQYSLGKIYTFSTELENCANRALHVNMDICKDMATINGCRQFCPDSKFVQLHKQANFFGLLPSEYLSMYMDLEDDSNTVYCSQDSEIWHKLCDKSHLTGSTMFKALGFDIL